MATSTLLVTRAVQTTADPGVSMLDNSGILRAHPFQQGQLPTLGHIMDDREQNRERQQVTVRTLSPSGVPLVAIGASAGGLEPLQAFFSNCPSGTGLAFVVLQHLPSSGDSALADILAKSTSMPVEPITDDMTIRPDRVYVLQPNTCLELEGSKFRMRSLEGKHPNLLIDEFFLSLAHNCGEQAYAVVLSGTGTDGSEGVKAIREAGGLVIAQNPEQAQFNGMPTAAIHTGATDATVNAEDMPEYILDFLAGQSRFASERDGRSDVPAPETVRKIIELISHNSPNDFTRYKEKTLARRIFRRMGLSHAEDEQAYLAYLDQSEEERGRLYRDLLISVTSFFRDSDSMQFLDEQVLASLVANAEPGQSIRVWVPGCATGEEAYSLAIMLHEQMRIVGKRPTIQIFATDIDEDALNIARNGLYPDSITSNLSWELLQRYFHREDDYYRVSKKIREEIVFAYQNVITGAPFSQLDLVTCRNLLIYLKLDVQTQLMGLFHFALKDNGILFLGSSETIGRKEDLFRSVDRRHRIYQRKPKDRQPINLPFIEGQTPSLARNTAPPGRSQPLPDRRRSHSVRIGERVRQHLLGKYAPPAVLVNKEGETLYFIGDTTDFLKHPSGEPSHRLFDLARDTIKSKLRGLFRQALKDGERVESAPFRASTETPENPLVLAFTPLQVNDGVHYLITFETQRAFEDKPRVQPEVAASTGGDSDPALVEHLEEELQAVRSELQSTIDDLEASNQDLTVSHEEAVSMNEELQSTNEELETSKEELQSLNEEMSTVNNELKTKVDQLDQAYNDLDNLLRSITSATLFIDTSFRIRLFTPNCRDLFNLVDTDIGRPLGEIKFKVADEHLLTDAASLLETLGTLESEVQSENGTWHLRRIAPYRTSGDKVDGVVITYTDITRLKMTQALEQQVEDSSREAHTHRREQEQASRERDVFFELSAVPFFVMAEGDYFYRLNPAWNRLFGWSLDELYEHPYLDFIHPKDREKFKAALKSVRKAREGVKASVRFRARDGSHNWLEWDIQSGGKQMLLGVVRDISERVHSADAVQRAQEELEKQILQRTQQLQAEKELAHVTLMSIGEAIITTDTKGRVTSINPVAERLTGRLAGEAMNRRIEDVLELRSDETGDPIDNPVSTALGENRTVAVPEPAMLVRKDGASVHVDASVSPVYNDSGKLLGAVAVFFDVSYARELTKRVRHRASHDDLTGLVNRSEFESRLATVVTSAREEGKIHALLFMDLDRFKIVNDTCGHLAGDELLRQITGEMQLHVRQRDTLARMGGDEFALILENCNSEQAFRIADDMLAFMRNFRFTWEDKTFQVGMSIGIALIDEHAASVRQVVHNADSACYVAKDTGRDRIYVYNQDNEDDLHHRTYMYWVTRVSQALEDDKIELVAQPIVAMTDGRTRGKHFEVLARLKGDDGETIPPAEFITAAERYNLMPRLDRYVVGKVFSWLSENPGLTDALDICSINLSVSTLGDDRFPDYLMELVNKHKVPSHKICFEITETMAIRNLEKTIELANEFKRQGFLFSLDDFGSGFASYHYLRRLPVDFLKIDGEFVRKIIDDPMDEAMVRSMNEIGHIMGKKTIAEFVETQAVFDKLKEIGVDYVQGFAIGRPDELATDQTDSSNGAKLGYRV
ncbi:EAL domain-containing protein [Marinobacter fonticola]|uniref:EAL domain-containing protein n=1 Tax=Marinobacter fonticola TaxID=2603215 RepID=UPI0011E7C42B|nr:EAL domain-containing protein [Marinobacter fonticola]